MGFEPNDPRVKAFVDEAAREGRIIRDTRADASALPAVGPSVAVRPQHSLPASLIASSEAYFQQLVIDLAHANGWTVAHFRPAWLLRKDGTKRMTTAVSADGKGFPDLLLARERVVFAECKSATGRVKPEQKRWAKALRDAGQEYYLWRPSQWAEVTEVLK